MPILIDKHVRLYRSHDDGERLLVMRYWPRGVRREAVDRWLRDLASARLLTEYRLSVLSVAGWATLLNHTFARKMRVSERLLSRNR